MRKSKELTTQHDDLLKPISISVEIIAKIGNSSVGFNVRFNGKPAERSLCPPFCYPDDAGGVDWEKTLNFLKNMREYIEDYLQEALFHAVDLLSTEAMLHDAPIDFLEKELQDSLDWKHLEKQFDEIRDLNFQGKEAPNTIQASWLQWKTHDLVLEIRNRLFRYRGWGFKVRNDIVLDIFSDHASIFIYNYEQAKTKWNKIRKAKGKGAEESVADLDTDLYNLIKSKKRNHQYKYRPSEVAIIEAACKTFNQRFKISDARRLFYLLAKCKKVPALKQERW
jgi:hypothetical protein